MWITLIGFLAAGKSTVAARVGRATGRRTVDLDAQVALAAGASVAEIFSRGGPAEFRDRERRALLDLPAGAPLVVATGAGTVERRDNLTLLRDRGLVVWLDADWEILRRRLIAAGSREPVIAHLGWDTLAALHRRRRPLYALGADLRLRSDRRDAEALARLVLVREPLWQARHAETGA